MRRKALLMMPLQANVILPKLEDPKLVSEVERG